MSQVTLNPETLYWIYRVKNFGGIINPRFIIISYSFNTKDNQSYKDSC